MARKRLLQLLYDHGNSIGMVGNEYSRALGRQRYEITVAYLYEAYDAAVVAATDADHVAFLDLPKREPLGVRIRALRSVSRLLDEGRFDYVICHRYKTARLAAVAALWRPAPQLLYAVHGIGYMNGLRRRLFAWLMFRRMQYLAVSEAVREDLLAVVPGLRDGCVSMVHNTIDAEALEISQFTREQARERLGLAQDAFVFGTVGRLVAVKRQAILIEALGLIREQAPNAVVAIVGGGKLADELAAAAAGSGLEDRIVLCGAHPAAANLMPAFDVFVLPSREESFGFVLLEAMAAGLPIITTAAGGIAEVVGPAAWLVDRGVAQAFAEAMLEIWRMPALQRADLGEQGHTRLHAHFTHNEIVGVIEMLDGAGS